MRWVWRAQAQSQTGAVKLEYAAVFVVAAVIATAVLAYGMPTLPNQMASGINGMICTAFDLDDCDEPEGTDVADSDDGDSEDAGETEDSENPGDPGGTDDEEGPGEEDDAEDGDDPLPEDEGVDFDPDLIDAYWDAEDELDEAEADLDEAEGEFDSTWDELLELLWEISGGADFERCFTEGDIGSCLMAIVGALPWGKLLKVASKIPKMWRLFDRWNSLRQARNARRTDRNTARDRRDELAGACPTSFPPGTPVLLAGGAEEPIDSVAAGDLVLSADPETGETEVRHVVAVHAAWGTQELVQLAVFADGATENLTATANHRFWTEDGWTLAEDLDPGDTLTTACGATAVVTGTREYTDFTSVHNLTVAELNTFFVGDDSGGVLVSNCNLAHNPKHISKKLRGPNGESYSQRQIKDAIHEAKRDLHGGSRSNPDVYVDIDTGDMYVQLDSGGRSADAFDNILNYL